MPAGFPYPQNEVIDLRGNVLAIDDVIVNGESIIGRSMGVYDIESFDPDYNDLSDAYEAAYALAKTAGGGIIQFNKSGTFRKPGGFEIDSDNIIIRGNGSVTITVDSDVGDGEYLFYTEKQTSDVSTTLSVSAALGDTSITVADASDFAAGDRIKIVSDSEYFSGIPGVSGFGVDYKSERRVIKSISGNVITLRTGLADSYSVSGHTVTVSKEVMWHNIAIYNLKFQGQNEPNTGPGIAYLKGCADTFVDVCWSGFGGDSFKWLDCDSFTVRGDTGWIIGFDPTDPDTENENYSGHDFAGATNGYIEGLKGRYLRRLVNFDTKNGSVISRRVVCVGFIAQSCVNGWGTHMCDDISFLYCYGDSAPCYYRGKNPTIIGCVIRGTSTSTSAALILLGQTDSAAFSEEPSIGKVNIKNNRLFGPQNGIVIRCSVEGGAIENNIIDTKGHGIWLYGKKTTDLTIANNVFDRSRGDPNSNKYGVFFENRITLNPMEEVARVYGKGNVYKNYKYGWVVHGSLDPNTGWNNVLLDGETMDDCGNSNIISLITLTGDGFFGVNCGAQNCTVNGILNSASGSTEIVRATEDRSHYYGPVIRHNNSNFLSNYGVAPAVLQLTSYSLGNRRTLAALTRITIVPTDPTTLAGNYSEYLVLKAGTTGTFPSVNASITSGSTQLVFDTNPNDGVGDDWYVYRGCYLSIAGAGSAGAALDARVIAWDEDTFTATLSVSASTTVSSANVNYQAPVVKGTILVQS